VATTSWRCIRSQLYFAGGIEAQNAVIALVRLRSSTTRCQNSSDKSFVCLCGRWTSREASCATSSWRSAHCVCGGQFAMGCLSPSEAGWSTPHLAHFRRLFMTQRASTVERAREAYSVPQRLKRVGSRVQRASWDTGSLREFHTRFLNSLVKDPLDDRFFQPPMEVAAQFAAFGVGPDLLNFCLTGAERRLFTELTYAGGGESSRAKTHVSTIYFAHRRRSGKIPDSYPRHSRPLPRAPDQPGGAR
jgi:hypothetical protein